MFTVMVSGEGNIVQDPVVNTLDPEIAARVQFIDGDFDTFDTLLKTQSEIQLGLVGLGISSDVQLDESANVVRVVVTRENLERASEAIAGISGASIELVAGQPGEPLLGKDQPLPYNLVEGGQQLSINSANQLVCTSGFSVWKGNAKYVLTASHCRQAGAYWYQGGAYLGSISAANASTQNSSCVFYCVDSALITSARAPIGNFNHNDNDSWHPVHFASPSITTGMFVCNTGVKSNGVLGWSSLAQCGTVTSVSTCSGWGCGFPAANFFACHGDSGGAVYRPTPYGVTAEGLIHSAVNWPPATTPTTVVACGYNANFTYLPNALAYHGATLVAPL